MLMFSQLKVDLEKYSFLLISRIELSRWVDMLRLENGWNDEYNIEKYSRFNPKTVECSIVADKNKELKLLMGKRNRKSSLKLSSSQQHQMICISWENEHRRNDWMSIYGLRSPSEFKSYRIWLLGECSTLNRWQFMYSIDEKYQNDWNLSRD